ncbi:hypothetical protein Bbelb_244820 [Branchiostoma belcheri]|nr:hypothetical protein Bbelb_244820 [Branchiostoma belcheri]
MDIVGRFLTTPSSDGTLRAELWADALLKILCWIPLALGGAVFGVDIFVFRLECFPLMHPASAVTANAGNNNGSAAGAFKQPGPYSSQLDEMRKYMYLYYQYLLNVKAQYEIVCHKELHMLDLKV